MNGPESAFPNIQFQRLTGEPIQITPGMSLKDYAEIHFIAAAIVGNSKSMTLPEDNVLWGMKHAELWLKAREERV